jgi:hypothetical protein
VLPFVPLSLLAQLYGVLNNATYKELSAKCKHELCSSASEKLQVVVIMTAYSRDFLLQISVEVSADICEEVDRAAHARVPHGRRAQTPL